MIVEVFKNKKRHFKSRSSKTSDKEIAERMLEVFEQECISLFKLNINKDKILNNERLFKKVPDIADMYDKNVKFCALSNMFL